MFASTGYYSELEGKRGEYASQPHIEILSPINKIFETKRHGKETNEKCDLWNTYSNIEIGNK